MTATTFNPLTYFEELKAAGVPEPQAKVQAKALADIIDEKLATKQDLLVLEERLTYKLTIRLGSMLTGSISILYVLLKFGH